VNKKGRRANAAPTARRGAGSMNTDEIVDQVMATLARLKKELASGSYTPEQTQDAIGIIYFVKMYLETKMFRMHETSH
jgi:hypothetical protein